VNGVLRSLRAALALAAGLAFAAMPEAVASQRTGVPVVAAPVVATPVVATSVVAAPFVAPSAWMLSLGTDWLEPRSLALAAAVGVLADRISAYCEAPDFAGLEASRDAWREAARDLRRLSATPFGPLLENRTLRMLDFWPTRTAQIESSIRGRAAGTLADARIGVTAKGLPALEYLLFEADDGRTAPAPARCDYARWLADDAAGQLAGLNRDWPGWHERLRAADADAETESDLLTDGVNVLIGSIDTLRQKYLEKPARSRAAQPPFDAWRSGATWTHLRVFVEGLRTALQGDDGRIGLDDVLRGRGLLVLADELERRIAAVTQALQTLPVTSRVEPGEALEAVVAAVERLQALLARDIADRLNVSVGFGENDGD